MAEISAYLDGKPCPYYQNNNRSCIEKYDFILYQNTWEYCDTGRYMACPFYKLLISKKNEVCVFVGGCPLFKYIDIEEFHRFSEVYCLHKKHVDCARFKLKIEGKTVSLFLMPDGSIIDINKYG